MKKYFFIIALILISLAVNAQKKVKLKTDMDSMSYALGVNLFKDLKKLPLDLNFGVMAKALIEASKNKSMLEDKAVNNLLIKLQTQLQKKQKKESTAKLSKTKSEGAAFLASNKTKEGVKTTNSGLQYIVIKEGEGKSPKATDKVKVHYEGTLINGKKFDSSYDRGEPAQFGLNQVIKGWTEGLQLMKEGGKYKFFIPSDLAYGDNDMTTIPAGSTLIFTVELLKVN